MATKTIGSAGDYTTIAGWSAYVKALGTMTEDETGQCIDNANYTRGADSDLTFTSGLANGNTISLEATTNKHTGDFTTGSRVVASVGFSQMYIPNYVTINDLEFRNTSSSNQARIFNGNNNKYNRLILRTNTNTNSQAIRNTSNTTITACRIYGGIIAIDGSSTCNIYACTVTNSITAFDGAGSGNCQNNVAYNNTTDFTGSWGTATNNASEDGTHPGTAGVTISGDPFDADGYTPAASGQLDGVGVDLSISLDAANENFNATPSIGAYEVIAGVTYAIYKGSTKLSAIYKGSTALTAAYKGSTRIF